jgi:hypothetical protein
MNMAKKAEKCRSCSLNVFVIYEFMYCVGLCTVLVSLLDKAEVNTEMYYKINNNDASQ